MNPFVLMALIVLAVLGVWWLIKQSNLEVKTAILFRDLSIKQMRKNIEEFHITPEELFGKK